MRPPCRGPSQGDKEGADLVPAVLARGHACCMTSDRYLQPGWFTRNVFNRLGVTVTLLTFDGSRYLVAPRGVTQWVRNLREAQEGTLRLGRRDEAFRAVEITDANKVPILRAYLKRWKMEVGIFFDGVGPDAVDTELQRIAPNHPVFRVDSHPR